MRSYWLMITGFIPTGAVDNLLIGGAFSHAETETTIIDGHLSHKSKNFPFKNKDLTLSLKLPNLHRDCIAIFLGAAPPGTYV